MILLSGRSVKIRILRIVAIVGVWRRAQIALVPTAVRVHASLAIIVVLDVVVVAAILVVLVLGAIQRVSRLRW